MVCEPKQAAPGRSETWGREQAGVSFPETLRVGQAPRAGKGLGWGAASMLSLLPPHHPRSLGTRYSSINATHPLN